ncbi:MAG: DinB family protein [Pseudorhodoplanes sp.]
MIDKAYLQRMSLYNRWQNESLYAAASTLSEAERKLERGAFWGSIHGTLSHLIWGDGMWLSRFAGTPKPTAGIKDSHTLYPDWEALKRERARLDQFIIDWSDGLDPAWLEGDLIWLSGAAQRELSRPKWILVTHFFNHQTHHRGQVHAMLTQADAKPGDTDLFFMPE